MCSRLYQQTSLPNLIGDESLDQSFEYFDVYKAYETTSILEGRCYQHFEETSCYTIFPKCDPITGQVTHPCRETCWDVKEACLQKLFSMTTKLVSRYGWVGAFLGNWSKEVDCDYLPSLHGSIPCYYKNVTCDISLNVTDGVVIVNHTQQEEHQLHDVIQYACANETFKMIGKSSITCLYSGEWSHPPPKCIPVKKPLHPVLVILPVLIMSLMIYTSLVFYVWCHKTKGHNLTRNRQYDAFVCYCYEGQDPDFAGRSFHKNWKKSMV